MKYKDPATGEWKEIYTKTADTLPVGSIVDFEGNEVPTGWEEVEDDKKGDFIRVSMNSDLTLTNGDITIVPFGKTEEQLGDGLSLTNNGGIKIGKNIKAVRVNAEVYYYTGTTNEIKSLYLYKNTVKISDYNTFKDITNYSHITASSMTTMVSEGDVIYLKVKGTTNDLFKNYATGTFLIVEVVK